MENNPPVQKQCASKTTRDESRCGAAALCAVGSTLRDSLHAAVTRDDVVGTLNTHLRTKKDWCESVSVLKTLRVDNGHETEFAKRLDVLAAMARRTVENASGVQTLSDYFHSKILPHLYFSPPQSENLRRADDVFGSNPSKCSIRNCFQEFTSTEEWVSGIAMLKTLPHASENAQDFLRELARFESVFENLDFTFMDDVSFLLTFVDDVLSHCSLPSYSNTIADHLSKRER